MTSKEMEARSGVPRANIRYYEVEGLLHPERLKNGYRSYSEEDLRTLEKIKLLRRLGVSVEEVRELVRGGETMETVLDRRLAEVGGERAALGRVERVCGDLRDAGASFDDLDAGRYLADLDAPALPEENGTWWDEAPGAGPAGGGRDCPRCTTCPGGCSPGSLTDLLVSLALLAALCLAGYNPARADSLAISLGTTVLLGVLEPLCLRLFAATPGKALLGMRLTAPDGEKLPYGAGVNRYLRMLWHGLGCYIPIWSLVQLYRSAARCCKSGAPALGRRGGLHGGALPAPVRPGRSLRLGRRCCWAARGVNCASQLPPNRGELTVAEFAENFNRQADYVGADLGGYLDETGSWQEVPAPPNVIRFDMEQLPGAEQFRYTVEDGRLTAVILSGEVENTAEWYHLPTERMAVALMAFAWAREDASFWTGPRKDQLAALDALDWEDGLSLAPGRSCHHPGDGEQGLCGLRHYGDRRSRERDGQPLCLHLHDGGGAVIAKMGYRV